jgi:hypothetical protein
VSAACALDTVPLLGQRVINLLSWGRRMTVAGRYLESESLDLKVGLTVDQEQGDRAITLRTEDHYASFGVYLTPGIEGFSFAAFSSDGNATEADVWKRYHSGEKKREITTVELLGGGDGSLGPGKEDHITITYWNQYGVVWEQVPSVLPVWKACAEVFTERGYSTSVGVLNAEQYGVPQTRRRAILVARRDGVPAALPPPTHSRYHSHDPKRLELGVQPWVSMATALGWDPDTYVISNYGTGGDPANRSASEPSATVTSKADRMKVVLRNNNQPKACVRPIDAPAGTIFFGRRANWVAWEQGDEVRKITPPEAAVLHHGRLPVPGRQVVRDGADRQRGAAADGHGDPAHVRPA